jgi:ribosomal 50S subunit-associated protein YjgA (DUF615 family)
VERVRDRALNERDKALKEFEAVQYPDSESTDDESNS